MPSTTVRSMVQRGMSRDQATHSAYRAFCLSHNVNAAVAASAVHSGPPSVLYTGTCCVANANIFGWQRLMLNGQHSTPRQLWRSSDVLLGRGCVRPLHEMRWSDGIPSVFRGHVAGVRASTADAPLPHFTSGCELREFRPLTVTGVIRAVRALPDKQCSSDPVPTHVLTVKY